jgi:cellulose synthase/poly-beta-1,6-N-acetylglucosamine synthase-like glycosyltransferase/chitodextrinase
MVWTARDARDPASGDGGGFATGRAPDPREFSFPPGLADLMTPAPAPPGVRPPRPQAPPASSHRSGGGPRKSERKGRRQWGRDRKAQLLAMVPDPVSDRRIALARLAIIVTVTAWLGYFFTWLLKDLLNPIYSSAISRTETISYLVIVTLLTASALAYLLSRLGFFYRTRNHHRASRAVLDQFYDTTTPTMTTIIPSYQEDAQVIRKTILSAALQEFPHKRIVLLIDDPARPKNRRARDLLIEARALPQQIDELLAGPATAFAGALDQFEADCRRGLPAGIPEMFVLASHYDAAVGWLESLAAQQERTDHTDDFFAEQVVMALADSLRAIANALRQSADDGAILGRSQIRRFYRRLVWTFRAEVTSFERKRFVSLSHEANKAMNLNSYIGLMGGHYQEVQTPHGPALVKCGPADCDLAVPDPDYVVTLDADSVLLPEYVLRLVHLLEQSEHRDMAIAQTPYSAFPGAATRLERIAGASTDLQHIVHQGLTYYDATFWVGANAVIRKRALDDIAETSYNGDWEIRHYIRDRTVIEDTESTIDMGIHGWKLFNCPERLSYSATPPDFGSLCIQRGRWANGGLLILPKLHRQSKARRARGERTRFGELFLRWNYMASICWSSFSLLVLLVFPFNSTLISPLLGLVALPYFMAMASDLRYCGYKRLDVLRVYGFNLILLPVNLSGTISSLVQGITASKGTFARTPKVRNRTVAPPFFVIAPYLVVALAGLTFYFAYSRDRVENMVYAGINVLLAAYAIVAFIGVRNSIVDGWIHGTSLLFKPARPRRSQTRRIKAERRTQPPPPISDWQSVLEVSFENTGQFPALGRPAAPRHVTGAAPAPGRGLTRPEIPDVPEEEPRRRLSVLRVLTALCLIAAVGGGGYFFVRQRILDTLPPIRTTWFAPYVDVTLTPTYQFQSTSADPARQAVLGFVVSQPGSPCSPSWGGFYTPAQANQTLALGSRIAQLEQDGAQVIASFGGQSHTSLDVGCTSVPALTQAYQSVISTYHLTTIDLDIEGAALNSFPAEERRAEAMAALEQNARDSHRQLSVWLTLPVEPTGLQDNAISVIQSMLRQRVQIAGVNLLAMDFSQPPLGGSTMLDQVEDALNQAHAQLTTLLPRYGLHLKSQQIWQRLGATVMIGQNNIKGERFTVADAQGLTGFAHRNHLGRVSMWSLNRDSQCGTSFAEVGILSDTCSGTTQADLQFAHIFDRLQGQAHLTLASGGNVLPPKPDTNPASDPYPQWSPTASYVAGYKVVENGEIYQAKWYNSGQVPAAQVQYSYETPWELLGPVLPGDKALVMPRLPRGTYPAWNRLRSYAAGQKVLFHRLPYQAKWDNQGVSPGAEASDPAGSPWQPLFTVPGEPSATSSG